MPVSDPYQAESRNALDAYSDQFEAITPNDDNDLPRLYKAVVVGGTGGAVVVHNHLGATVTVWGVAGMPLQGVRPRRILAAGTDATPLIGII
jgi:hypothetical protein